MALHYVICAVRSRPEPEIHEVTVPSYAASRTKRELALKGWETIFVMAAVKPPHQGRPRRGA